MMKSFVTKKFKIKVENKMENKKYHTVGTVLKSNRKTKNTTLSEQF
jgi:hypothetical protein